mgnify:CR=1 FL=1
MHRLKKKRISFGIRIANMFFHGNKRFQETDTKIKLN